MRSGATELELPLADPDAAGEMGELRFRHLSAVPGVDEAALWRLACAFGSLGAIYAAPTERLTSIVGPVVAARIRWFLDAPLSTGALRAARLARQAEVAAPPQAA